MKKVKADGHRQGGDQSNVSKWSVGLDKGLHSSDIEKFRIDAHRAFAKFVRVPHERLMWMTIISAAIVVRPADHSDVVAATLRDMERKLISRCRRRFPGLRIRGVHEIDVLSLSRHMGPHKVALLRDLGVDVPALHATLDNDDRQHEQRILIPHMHCVIDLAEHSSRKVADELHAEFPGAWRILGKSLHAHRTIPQNLERLASYSTKFKVAYSDCLGDRATKFGTLYEVEWRESIVITLQAIGLGNLLFRYGGS